MSESFSSVMISHVDAMFKQMVIPNEENGINDRNFLAPLVFESLSFLREVLCAYDDGMNNTIHESIMPRLSRITSLSKALYDTYPFQATAVVKEKATIGYNSRLAAIKGSTFQLRDPDTKESKGAYDLRNHDWKVSEIHLATGLPQIKLTSDMPEHKGMAPTFELEDDVKRCHWVGWFRSYEKRRELENHYSKMLVRQKCQLMLDKLYVPSVPLKQQHIFFLLPPGDEHDNRDRANKGTNFDTYIKESTMLGEKKKPRIFEFDLKSNPKMLRCFKKGEQHPYIELSRTQILDFKVDPVQQCLTLYISRDKGRNAKQFFFATNLDRTRFLDVFENGFRRTNSGFLFAHAKIIDEILATKRLERQSVMSMAAETLNSQSSANVTLKRHSVLVNGRYNLTQF
jgi:hypothetical protein